MVDPYEQKTIVLNIVARVNFAYLDVDRCYPKRGPRERPYKLCKSNLDTFIDAVYNDYKNVINKDKDKEPPNPI